jgi:mitotic spindle assembly checkpoint protein MAD1
MTDSSPFVDVPKRRESVVGNTAGESSFRRLSFGNGSEIEALKVQVQALTYELKESKNTMELNKVESETKVNNLIKQLTEQEAKYGSVSSDQIYFYNQNKELTKKLQQTQEESKKERDSLEKKLSDSKRSYQILENELESLQHEYRTKENRLVSLENKFEYEVSNSSSEIKNLRSEVDEAHNVIQRLRQEAVDKDTALEALKAKLNSIPSELEIESNQSVQKQITEQIQYIKDLEEKNLHQAEQIKKLTLNKQNVEILKDEKNTLLAKLSNVDKLNDQLNDLTLENLNLKQELSKWNVYLTDIEDVNEFFQNAKFLKGENMILNSNFEKLSADLKRAQNEYNELFIKNGSNVKEVNILKDKYENLLKINYELEQQKSLLFEESNFLREQLKNLDNELSLNEDDKSKYIQNLEKIIGEYKNQLNELTKQQKSHIENSNKRQRTDNDEDDTTRNFQTSIMKLKNELLQLNNEKSRLTNENVLLLKKLESFESINEQKVRILQLRNNPFQNDQIIKKSKLDVLERMNSDLLRKAEFTETVPKSVFGKSELDKQELETKIQQLNKKSQRLREIFQSKSLEFIDAVYSLLGFKLEFLPSNKVKLISKYVNNDQNCITIDPINQTLKANKFSDEDDEFFKVYETLISFWIKEKNEIPCFLSALTLELFEKEQIQNNV